MLVDITPIIQNLESATRKCGATTLITIDGPAGSGKTTLAADIAKALATTGTLSTTIHMDSLYEGWEKALTGSLTTMLRKKVIPALQEGGDFILPYFDWLINQFGPEESYTSAPITILEGVGSGQRATRPFTSVAVWIEAPLEIALERVLDRDGYDIEGPLKGFKKAELVHFAEEGTKAAAHHTFYSA